MSEGKLKIDKSKPAYLELAEKLEKAGDVKMSFHSFNMLSQEEKILALRRFAGVALDLGDKKIRCLDKDHEDVHPSMSFCRETGGLYCFACGKALDIFDLAGAVYGIKDFKAQYKKVVKLFVEYGNPGQYDYQPEKKVENKGRKKSDKLSKDVTRSLHNRFYVPLVNGGFADSTGLDLAKWYIEEQRGLPLGFVARFPIRGWAYEHEEEVRSGEKIRVRDYYIVFINDDGGEARRWVYREPADAYRPSNVWWNKKGELGFFNSRVLQREKGPIFICESAFDALAVMYLTGFAAVGLNGVEHFKKLKTLDKPLILMFDSDFSGESAAQDFSYRYFAPDFLRKGFKGESVFKRHKDVNEALVAEPDAAASGLREIYAEACEFYENGGGYRGNEQED